MINSMTDLPTLANYLARIGAEPRSLRTAVVKEMHGDYWQDVAKIRIRKDGTIDAPEDYAPWASEVDAIKVEVTSAQWPTSKKIAKGFTLPPELEAADSRNLFYIYNRTGELLMIHQRLSDEERTSKGRYAPWTLWSDDKWRKAEPDDEKLPIWGMELIGNNSVLFIHEGAKSARTCHELVNPRNDAERIRQGAHPWGVELSNAAHAGWIGGALNPSRTDWSEINRMGFDRVYIVADNDASGKAAIPKIAAQLRGMPVYSIEFTDQWPASFDLADDFPEDMFSERTGTRIYKGPMFRDVVHTATWATDIFVQKKGKSAYFLRKEFSEMWVWINDIKRFVCKEMPNLVLDVEQFNAKNRPFSHINNIAQLMQSVYSSGETFELCYHPGSVNRIINVGGRTKLNQYLPSSIRPVKGNAGPWMEFLSYLFPNSDEQKEIERWCATLIARPDVRILYGLLLVTETQGIGKTTLGAKVLAPLVGLHNTSFPNEQDMVESAFNDWLVRKRLVVVGEIYSGHSFKAYNKLKSCITDKDTQVSEKYMKGYTIDIWAHIVACSNSKKPLRIEDTDRRWFYPKMNEVSWTKEKFASFYDWLDGGGLGIIMRWAMDYGDYINTGEVAPMTDEKRKLIEASEGESIRNFKDRLKIINGHDLIAVSIRECRDHMVKQMNGRVFESPRDFVKAARSLGWFHFGKQIKAFNTVTEVVLSPALMRKIIDEIDQLDMPEEAKIDKRRKIIHGNLKRFEDIVTDDI